MTLGDFIRDGLQASVSMGRKAALAGIWAGGGGGVIARPGGHDVMEDSFRRDLFQVRVCVQTPRTAAELTPPGFGSRVGGKMQDYGEFVTSLRGCMIAAEDTGTSVRDMDLIYSRTRFASCISEAIGGSGHPAVATAQGVVRCAGLPGARTSVCNSEL